MARTRKRNPEKAADGSARGGGAAPVLWFVARFAGIWAVALILLALVPGIEEAAIDNTVTSLITGAGWVGLQSARAGEFLHVGSVSLQIVPDCTPLMPITSLWAAILAFPAALRWRAIGLAAGAIVLWLYNLARIYALAGVLRWRPSWFEFVHVYLWQTVTLAVVFALFLLWLSLQSRGPRAAGEARAI